MYKIHDAKRDVSLDEQITELYARLDGVDGTLEDLEQRVASGGDGSDGPNGELPAEYLAQLDAQRQENQLIGDPTHTRRIETGAHEEGDTPYHHHGRWGVILTTGRPVNWREASVNARDSGTTLLEVYPIDRETYELGPVYRTRELDLHGGPHSVNPELTFSAGDWFVTRDTERENPVPMKRALATVQWSEFREKTADLPITFRRTWQMGREPGTDAFDEYEESGWHQVMHQFGNWEIGYMD